MINLLKFETTTAESTSMHLAIILIVDDQISPPKFPMITSCVSGFEFVMSFVILQIIFGNFWRFSDELVTKLVDNDEVRREIVEMIKK